MNEQGSARVNITVPFHDVDPAGRVWHGNYFKYFEEARCKVLERLGYNYAQMKEAGVLWPMIDVSARFTGPVSFHDAIEVEARLTEWEYRLVFDYRITDPEGHELARGRTVQVPVDATSDSLMFGPDTPVARAMGSQGSWQS